MSRYRTILIIGLLAVFSSFGVYALGQTDTMQITDHPDTVLLNYGLDVTLQSTQNMIITREMVNNTNRNYPFPDAQADVTFSSGSSGDVLNRMLVHSNGTDFLSYTIIDNLTDRNVLKDPSSYTGPESTIDHLFPSLRVRRYSSDQQLHTDSFVIEIPDSQFVPAGTYSDQILLQLFHDYSYVAGADELMEIIVTVDPIIGLSIGDVGSQYDPNGASYSLAFGELTPGESLQAQATALSNTNYLIEVFSQNGGNLKHLEVNETIPYTLLIDGSPVVISPSAPVEVISGSATTSTGTAHTIEIVIGSFNWVPAGDYEDNLSFSITAN